MYLVGGFGEARCLGVLFYLLVRYHWTQQTWLEPCDVVVLTDCIFIDTDEIVWMGPPEGLMRGSLARLRVRSMLALLALQTLLRSGVQTVLFDTIAWRCLGYIG